MHSITIPRFGHPIIFAIAFMTLSGAAQADRTRFDVQATGSIGYVIDGDTAVVALDDAKIWGALRNQALQAQRDRQRDLSVSKRFNSADLTMTVRLANIDTEESVHRDSSRNTRAGEQASRFAKATFNGPATIRCFEIGYYGRPICSVATQAGDWGEIMIRQGMSEYVEKWGRHPHHHQRYLAAQANR